MENAENDVHMREFGDEAPDLDNDGENVPDRDDADIPNMEIDDVEDPPEMAAESEPVPDSDPLTRIQDETVVRSKAKSYQSPFQIFLIDTKRLDLAIGKDCEESESPLKITNDSRIEFIINSYNSKTTRRLQTLSRKRRRTGDKRVQKKMCTYLSPSPCKKKPQEDQTQVTPPAPNNQNSGLPSASSSSPQAKEKSREHYVKSNYKLKFTSPDYDHILYTQPSRDTDLETGEAIIILSKIRFLIRKNSSEIFALPSKYGRWVVQKWADTDFPLSVASVILKKKSTVRKTIKSFFSNRYYTKIMMSVGETLNQDQDYNFNPQITTSFTAIVDSLSIRNILNIQNENVTLKCETGFDSLCFKTRADLTTYANLCLELSRIYAESNPQLAVEYTQYFTQVNSDTSTPLDECVLEELKKFAFRDSLFPSEMEEQWEKKRIRDFLVSHKDTQSYLDAESFWLSFVLSNRRFESKRLNESPSLFELCQLMKPLRDKIKKETGKYPKVETFLKALRLHFSVPPDENVGTSSRFLSCLEGHYVERQSEEQFWKLSGRWYSSSYVYIHDIHLKLHELFNNAIIRDKNSSYLYKPWPKVWAKDKFGKNKKIFKPEKEYNKLYENNENFFIGDDIVVIHGLELFDLMQFVPHNRKGSTICFYHVKRYFNSESMRIVDRQIAQAVASMKNSDILKVLHEYLMGHTNNFVKNNFQDFEDFKMECERATFVLGLLHNNPDTSLENDYIYRVQITLQNLEETFSESPTKLLNQFQKMNGGNGTVEELARSLHSQLKEGGYIGESDFISAKMTKCVRDNAGLRKNDPVRKFELDLHYVEPEYQDFIKQTILTFVQPGQLNATFGMLGAKMILINLRNQLSEKGITFKICEIEHLDAPAMQSG